MKGVIFLVLSNVLKVSTTPMKLNVNTTNAKVDITTPQPKVEINRTTGGYEMQSTPLQIKIDQSACFTSLGAKNVFDSIADFAMEGKRASQEVSARYAQEGDRLMRDQSGRAFSNIVESRQAKNTATIMEFLPNVRPQISFEGGGTQINYTKDQVNANWSISKPTLTYTPGRVDVSVAQYNSIQIQYTAPPNTTGSAVNTQR